MSEPEIAIEQPQPPTSETRRSGGLSEWKRAVKAVGQHSLAGFIESMDPGNVGKANAHRVIAERIKALGMPSQPYITAPIESFASDPERYMQQLRRGDYYFASIRPGMHLAHAESGDEVITFVRAFAATHPEPKDQQQELYLSRNGEPVLCGHIVVKGGDAPSPIYAEFTNRDFKPFHHGERAPEIVVSRDRYRFNWDFRRELAPGKDDWRNDDEFVCNGGVQLTRPEMARKIFSAIQQLPHEDGTYLPGYYEVLLERTDGTGTRAAYIEAITSKTAAARL